MPEQHSAPDTDPHRLDPERGLSFATKIYLLLAPLPLVAVGLLAFTASAFFDRCDKNCVSVESSLWVHVLGPIAGLVLFGAGGTALAAWRASSRRQTARRSILLALIGVPLFLIFWGVLITASVETTT